ncbi:MAG: membrane protein insertion efficiency factor YidD [Candidatus Yonathbacteria bacterium RIFOXYC2_FULL_47_9]|nr:MAG: membrane protein insertion efficiency factor YidD [Candidatus Yonathbacteria bacterium RIFOXYC2_FULL_47_9]HAT68256.1 membrane protein insertion efficiency factor YidD [Candidatus Yonathbacteria bacterium]
MRTVIISLISFYQKVVSPDTGVFSLNKGTTCVFYPTCSEYMKQGVIKYGSLRGLWMGMRRILRCHPWQKEHIDPLP